MRPLRLGTRGSQLALYQARTVAEQLAQAGGPPCEMVIIKTSGDQLQDAPLSQVGGKRLFVKEIEDALLSGTIDLAVHSSKDMPALLPEGLTIGAVLPREDPRDAVVLPQEVAGRFASETASLERIVAELGDAPTIGTGSVRRVAQLSRLMPAARFQAIRGNLDTRLRKLDQGDYAALVLAAAGLRRLGFAARISMMLPVSACLPAPGQGVIAVEIRSADEPVRASVARITDGSTAAALEAERTLVAALGGGCQLPIGAVALPADGDLELRAIVVSLDGARAVRSQARAPLGEARRLGERVARRLLLDGAGEILEDVRGATAAIEGIQP